MDNPPKVFPIHRPVLVREVLELLDLHSGESVVDGTVGAGGHSREILKQIGSKGILLGLDRDPMMLNLASEVLQGFSNVRLVASSYANLTSVLEEQQIAKVDRVLLDLGLSSDQLADESRGFGFESDGDLDLRFDISQGQPAWKLLEISTEKQLEILFREYGEERFSKIISRRFVETRRNRSLRSAKDIAGCIVAAIPKSAKQKSEKNPATRIFQALRIAVNNELDQLIQALENDIPNSLVSGGIVAVISFHSLEDRIVKQHFRDKNRWDILTSKPVQASQIEIKTNPRSRTAKLRAARKK